MEHKEIPATWRKINYYFKKRFIGPQVQICVITSSSITTKVLTDGDEIHGRNIAWNIEHFSSAETSPHGSNSFLHNEICPHGKLELCDRVLHSVLDDIYKRQSSISPRPINSSRTPPHPTNNKQLDLIDWILDSTDKVLKEKTV